MNESGVLRSQMQAEHDRASVVVAACRESGATPVLQACAEYLIHAVPLLLTRDRARVRLYYAQHPAADQTAFEALEAQAHVLEQHKEILPGSGTYVESLDHYLKLRAGLEGRLSEGCRTVEQWRSVAFVDAGSILDERTRYANFAAALAAHG